MKKLLILPLAAIAMFAFSPSTNDVIEPGKKLPAVNIKDMAGNPINTDEATNDGNPIIISFWATWCKPCKLELNTIAEEYDVWQEETGVKLIAVSVDDQKTTNTVEPVVNAAGWEYDIWMDPNGDFKRALGVNFVPHTFLLDGERNIVYSHNNFVPGDEEVLYEHVKEVSVK